jgi:hypothetical protein
MELPNLRANTLASNILFGGLLFALLVTAVRSPSLFQHPVTAGALVLSYALYGGLFYAIRIGKGWARTLFLVGTGLYILYSVAYYEKAAQPLYNGFWLALNWLVTYASRVIAFIILVKSSRLKKPE